MRHFEMPHGDTQSRADRGASFVLHVSPGDAWRQLKFFLPARNRCRVIRACIPYFENRAGLSELPPHVLMIFWGAANPTCS